jgi:uncharacterized membrane protein
MAVFQARESEGCTFTIRRNCALSWRATKYLVLFFACCFGAVGAYFASIGAWLVLPFAGLEFVVLAAGFYFSALAGHSREVIEIRGPVVRVLRGRRRLEEIESFPANWTRVQLWRDPRGWYPSRLVLRCHGRGLEVAAKVVEAEREELASALRDWVGLVHYQGGGSKPAAVSGLAAQSLCLPGAQGARACFDVGTPGRAGPQRDGSVESGGSDFQNTKREGL